MENTINFFSNLSRGLKSETLEYYSKCYDYFKNLFYNKGVDINTKLSDEKENVAQDKIKKMISSTNAALITIGISPDDLISEFYLFEKNFIMKKEMFSDYNSFFNLSLKDYINKHLFVIILEYLMNIDKNKIKNLDLFDLLPRKFIKTLDQFTKSNKISQETEINLRKILPKIEVFIDVSTFSVDLEKFNQLDKTLEELSNVEILKQLENARKENIEFLEKPLIKQFELNNDSKLIQKNYDLIQKPERKLIFLENFGNLPKIDSDLIIKFNINVKNLVNSGKSNQEFLDLESLFYFLSILKMLGISFPFTSKEIMNLIEKHVSGNVFSTAMYHKPNPLSNFYGLSILTELNILNEVDIIDLLDIEMFLENELKSFRPEKFFLNFYSLLALKILERNGGIITDKKHLVKPLIDLDLFNLKNVSLPLDMFCHLGLLKLIDENVNLNIFKNIYNNEIKKLITSNVLINDNVTDSARVLLIYDMLDLKEEELFVLRNLLIKIVENVEYFQDFSFNNDFNWKTNKLAYKVELRMLFWVLLGCSLYIPLNNYINL